MVRGNPNGPFRYKNYCLGPSRSVPGYPQPQGLGDTTQQEAVEMTPQTPHRPRGTTAQGYGTVMV